MPGPKPSGRMIEGGARVCACACVPHPVGANVWWRGRGCWRNHLQEDCGMGCRSMQGQWLWEGKSRQVVVASALGPLRCPPFRFISLEHSTHPLFGADVPLPAAEGLCAPSRLLCMPASPMLPNPLLPALTGAAQPSPACAASTLPWHPPCSQDPLCRDCPKDAAKCESCETYTSVRTPGVGEQSRGVYMDAATGRCRACAFGCNECSSEDCSACNEQYTMVGRACKR